MILNLIDIIIQQDELDREILLKNNTNYSETFNERKLATLVEVAELANEVRCFKYWSVKSPSEKDIILAEYVDVLHFISGFCVQYNIHPIFDIKDEKIVVLPKKVLTKKFNNLFQLISRIKVNKNISKQILNIYKQFIKLGFNLGYTIDDITSAYTKKHAINHERQKTNY